MSAVKVSKVVSGIVAAAKASKKNGVADLAAKDIAKLIKAQLAANFPGVKFSVKSDYNSVRVSWVDGPVSWAVNDIIYQYKFGGFDGSIDLAYDSQNWLLPDGTVAFASTSGTEGSLGYVSAGATDCPVPGAVLVDSPVKYISSNREVSDEHEAELVAQAEEYYGFKIPEGQKPWQYYVQAQQYWAGSLALRLEADLAKSQAENAKYHVEQ